MMLSACVQRPGGLARWRALPTKFHSTFKSQRYEQFLFIGLQPAILPNRLLYAGIALVYPYL